jgi:hypothetical protein
MGAESCERPECSGHIPADILQLFERSGISGCPECIEERVGEDWYLVDREAIDG